MAKRSSRAYRWYNHYTIEQLHALHQQIESENPITEQSYDGGLYLYPKAVRAKFGDIAQAITWHLEDAKKAAGTYVEPAGYSGKNIRRR